MGAGATAERRVAVLSLALDKSSRSSRPASFSWAGCPSLTTRLAGPGSIPAPSEQWRQVRIATSVIIRLVINYVVAVIWGNPFSRQSGVVCSRVLDLLQSRRPLSVLTPSLDPGSREPTQAESDIVVCAFSQGAHWHATVVYPSNLNRAANTAIRQQFLFSLLEERRFFAHLVLRYVRAARNSASPPEARKSLPAESSSQRVLLFAPGFDVARRRAPGDTVARRKSPRGLRQALNQKSVQFGQFRRGFRLAGRLPRAT